MRFIAIELSNTPNFYTHLCYVGSSEDEIWEDESDTEMYFLGDNDKAPLLPSYLDVSSEKQKVNSLIKWLLRFLLSLQAKYYVSDAVINKLLSFLSVFFGVLGRFSPFVECLSKQLPLSSLAAHKCLGHEQKFTKYVACPKCWKLYLYEEAVEQNGSLQNSKLCSYIKYPHHPWPSRRGPCNADLLKSVELSSGKRMLYPRKVYCYKSLESTFQELLMRPGFHDNCEYWRTRDICETNLYGEIYDGEMWKNFQHDGNSPFLSVPFNYALMLNVDWFQPYTHTNSSIGVIYLSVLNLPCHIRYKRSNVILIGIIPGPSEPSHDINAFLEPLVSELKNFWKGIILNVNTSGSYHQQKVRCAVICVSCDLPAGRKVCGFLSHSAAMGCSRCTKSFPGEVGNLCYAGFERDLWQPRTNVSHRINVEEIQKCKTKVSRNQKESELGCRYSVLLDLPYFDAPKMLAIDPMHNLFLGTAKHMISIWINSGMLNNQFDKIQTFVDNINVPSDVGRIPRKIEVGFSGFKADQFKSWTNLYSIPALFDILPAQHLECWRHFVLACRILSQHKISSTELDLADGLLIQFCRRVESLYGKEAVTPNMHMHGHLKEVIVSYGPVQEFWLFSFERYNGILGKQPSNNREIESQIMGRFLKDSMCQNLPEDEFESDFRPLCEAVSSTKLVGSALQSIASTVPKENCKFPTKCTRCVLTNEEISNLLKLYSKYHNLYNSNITVNSIYFKYKSITLNEKEFTSTGKRKMNPAISIAQWDTSLFGNPPTKLPTLLFPHTNKRPVNIHYFMKVNFTINDITDSLLLANVSWFFPHPDCYAFGKPVELWCSTQYENWGIHSFLPINCLVYRCAHGLKHYKNEQVLVVVPLVE